MPVHKNLIFSKYAKLCLPYNTQFCPIGEIFFWKALYTQGLNYSYRQRTLV